MKLFTWLIIVIVAGALSLLLQDLINNNKTTLEKKRKPLRFSTQKRELPVFGRVFINDKIGTSSFVYLDTETTGNKKNDEVVEIAIIDASGDELVNTLIRPKHRKRWVDAEAIHGISPEQVVNAPMLETIMPDIIAAIKDKNVVIYNAKFDSRYLKDALEYAAEVHCCMLRYAEFYGEWNDLTNDYRYQKLINASRHIGYCYEGNHRALADCRATRAVWMHMNRFNSYIT